MTAPNVEQEGRRIYIHKDSLRDMARASDRRARLTVAMLSDVRMAKVAHHYMVADGVELGAVRPEVARWVTDPIHRMRGNMVGLLRITGYTPNLPYRDERYLPVLGESEEVTDTCHQDGYFTFATGEEAARRMFEDREKMKRLRAKVAAGEEPDLTIISGNTLGPFEPTDPEKSLLLSREWRNHPVLSLDELASIDAEVRGETLRVFSSFATRVGLEFLLSRDEHRIIDGMVSAQGRVLTQPSFG